MNYTQSAGEKSTVKLTITFTEDEWNAAKNTAYAKTRNRYTVPGFRKGKAPKPVIENYYGKGVFFEEAFNNLYNEYYYAIIEKERENFTPLRRGHNRGQRRGSHRSRSRQARGQNRAVHRFKNPQI